MSGTTYKGPINPNPKDGEASIIIYSYVPALALGVIGVITFAVVLAAHIALAAKKRGYRSFHALLATGCLMECGGYAARIYSHYRPFVVSAFVAQYFLIVVAPVLFSAAIYLSLTLAVKAIPIAESLLLLSPKRVLIFFVSADCVTTVIQVVGAALIGASESAKVQGKSSSVTPEQANDILLAGLAIQTFSFLVFLAILVTAIIRSRRQSPPPESTQPSWNSLRRLLWITLFTANLILLRTVFRLAETAQGFFGFASTHEALFGCLEYAPVVVATITWAVLPPCNLLRQSRECCRAGDAEKASG